MRHFRTRSARILGKAAAVAAIIAIAAVVVPTLATAAPNPQPSDNRAVFVVGNVTTCASIGFGSSTQLGSASNTSNSDANVSGVVKTNAGTTQPGVGQELDVTLLNPLVTIDAVVVKGGPAYNKYVNAAFLPPTLGPDQHYISPLNPGGNVPTISHWFVCYHLTTPPPAGSLAVTKAVIPPDGTPVAPLPTSYSAIVNCNDGVHTNITVTFGAGGGAGNPASITGIAPGTVCTVVEQNTASFPAGTVVTYNPSGADDPGVTITGSVGITVGITNDFSKTEVETGSLSVSKVVSTSGTLAEPLLASYTAHVSCDDGTEVDVDLPGNGGAGTPVVTGIKAGSICTVVETTVLNNSGQVSYNPVNVDSTGVAIIANTTTPVTITNTFIGSQGGGTSTPSTPGSPVQVAGIQTTAAQPPVQVEAQVVTVAPRLTG